MSPFTVIFLVLTIGVGFYAQHRVTRTYKLFSQVPSRNRIRGCDAANYVLKNAGVEGVEVVSVAGFLTDHYDPRIKRLSLSEENFEGTSLAALGVAAHEAGHAIQHAQGYKPLELRMSLIPVTTICSKALPIIVPLGFMLGPAGMLFLKAGVLIYVVIMLFQLITLPVEFDASRRAKLQLASMGLIEREEMPGVTKTLHAAGFTYVAAFIASFAHLIRLILLRGKGVRLP